MALSHLVIWHPSLPTGSSAHWWMMQVGMVIGYFTAWPVNRWLVMKRWKEKMDHRKHLAMLVEEMEPAGSLGGRQAPGFERQRASYPGSHPRR